MRGEGGDLTRLRILAAARLWRTSTCEGSTTGSPHWIGRPCQTLTLALFYDPIVQYGIGCTCRRQCRKMKRTTKAAKSSRPTGLRALGPHAKTLAMLSTRHTRRMWAAESG